MKKENLAIAIWTVNQKHKVEQKGKLIAVFNLTSDQ